jgi:hypothetical protein
MAVMPRKAVEVEAAAIKTEEANTYDGRQQTTTLTRRLFEPTCERANTTFTHARALHTHTHLQTMFVLLKIKIYT